jgi:[acyl-carrier-protein] S-malonyltransferase
MGRDAFEASAAARAVFESADAALGFKLSKLCFEGPEADLTLTENQQPAILTVSIALLRALEERTGLKAAFVAGHSLGEYSALVASGALEFEDAVCAVHARGRFMQEAVPQGRGAMAAVMGCGPDVVLAACRAAAEETGRPVSPANFNGPAQTAISGDAIAVEVACTRARESGAKRAVPLDVSAPFHCELMAPAASKLALQLGQVRFSDPSPPVVTNVEASACADGGRLSELLEQQVTAAVRFTEMVEYMAGQGVDRVLEVGPGRVLTGLVARIDRKIGRSNLSSLEGLDEAVAFVNEQGA